MLAGLGLGQAEREREREKRLADDATSPSQRPRPKTPKMNKLLLALALPAALALSEESQWAHFKAKRRGGVLVTRLLDARRGAAHCLSEIGRGGTLPSLLDEYREAPTV